MSLLDILDVWVLVISNMWFLDVWFLDVVDVWFLDHGVVWFVNLLNMMGGSGELWHAWVVASWVGGLVLVNVLLVLVRKSGVLFLGAAMSDLGDPSSAGLLEVSFSE